MFGLLLFQSAYYFLHYRSDYLPYKALVSLLTLICSVSWSFIIVLMWHYLVTSRDSPIEKLKHNPGIQFVVFCAPWPSGLLSQIFFAVRSAFLLVFLLCYWVSERNKTYLSIFTLFIFASAGVGLGAIIVDGLASASFTGSGRTPAIVKHVGSLIQAWLVILPFPGRYGKLITSTDRLWINAGTDLVITTCLVLQLNKGRKDRGNSTEQVLARVLKLSLTSAALSFAWAIIDAITLQLTATRSNYHLILFLQLPFIYSLCAIATLNFRDTLRTTAFSADSPHNPTNAEEGSSRAR
ncbi:hypothetical protein BT69DRAFT_1359011 [Atractiella rhizophila]|nr:hypothetical protein BT69DRAFT_1359011 [Atractiella rhizophila]